MHALRHQIKVVYRHQPARRHLLPITSLSAASFERASAFSLLIPVIDPYWPRAMKHKQK